MNRRPIRHRLIVAGTGVMLSARSRNALGAAIHLPRSRNALGAAIHLPQQINISNTLPGAKDIAVA
jgi:hypothetical protein